MRSGELRSGELPSGELRRGDLWSRALTRRSLLRGTLASVGWLLASRLLGPAEALGRGVGPGKLLKIERSRLGTTLWLELAHGPFPDKGKPYKDARTAVFVPKHFRQRGRRVDTVLHFHGHHNTVSKALRVYKLREQMFDSKQNAILVVPQGPIDAEDSSGGKLDRPGGLLRFLTEIRKTLQTPAVRKALRRTAISRRARIGTLIISAHSGGYRVTARCLKHGGYPVSEVYLFDSLYGDVPIYRNWLAETKRVRDWRRSHKLVDFFATGRPEKQSRRLMKELDKAGVSYVVEEKEGQLTRQQLIEARAVFIRTGVGHRGVVFRHNALRDCLFASRLQRLPGLKTRWFRGKRAPRHIDRR